MESSGRVIGRFAPSPTGRMHMGNIWAAVLSYASVRQQGGEWILRHEDIDPQRSKRVYIETIEDDLRWLGMDWDRRFLQSERVDRYEIALERLREQGLLYPTYKTRRERLASSAPQMGDGSTLGTDINVCPQKVNAATAATAIRCGEEELILRRSDGAWAYQLAVVVDDGEMGVTEVVRGRDLEGSVRYHHFLQDRLGYSHPEYKHVPLLINEAIQRLSKRDKSLDMSVLRETYSPEQLIGKIAFYARQVDREEAMSLEELVRTFDYSKIPHEDIVTR